MRIISLIKTGVADESGATTVEYAILGGLAASLLVLAALGVSDLLGHAWSFLSGEVPFVP